MVSRAARALMLAPLLVGCSSAELLRPELRVVNGPANARAVKRIVVLPATCADLAGKVATQTGTVDLATGCAENNLAAIDEVIRASLHRQGFELVAEDKLATAIATQPEVHQREENTSGENTQRRSLFEYATPVEQLAILHKVDADALLTTRVLVGATSGLAGRRTVTVQVQLRNIGHDELVWARRCELETTLFKGPVSLESAARCAVEGEAK